MALLSERRERDGQGRPLWRAEILGSKDRASLSGVTRSLRSGRQADLESDSGEQVLRVPDRRHPSLVTPGIAWINPHRWRKIVKRISKGTGVLAKFHVAVNFPLSGDWRLVGPVTLVDCGVLLWRDSGTSEQLIDQGTSYTASTPGIHKVRLFVLIFDWAGERHVRRSYWGTNAPMGLDRVLQRAANKIALTTSKSEISMYRRLHPWTISAF